MRLPDAGQQPICSGVLITDKNDLLFALATRDCWKREYNGSILIPVTGIGGGQLPGERMQECARREAREEISCDVDLIDSRVTYMEDESGKIEIISCEDIPAPLLYQIQRRPDSRPYATGLPAGDQLHIGIFRAVPRSQPMPGDVPALLWVPSDCLSILKSEPSLAHIKRYGGRLVAAEAEILHKTAYLVLPNPSTERLLLNIVEQFGTRVLQQ